MEKAEEKRRDIAKLIRFTPSELAVVNDRARACGRPVACYIREVALGGKPKARSPVGNDRVVRELARVANRLRSLHAVAATRALPEASEFGAAVDDVVDAIRRIA